MAGSAAKVAFAALVLLCLAFAAWMASAKGESERGVLFFAYGANLDGKTLSARAGGFESVQLARLEGYRLAFQTNRNTEFGVANLAPDAQGSVAGALYRLTPAQMAALDKYSNVPNFYEWKTVKAGAGDGDDYDAVAYVLAGDTEFAAPSGPYLNATLDALAGMGYGQSDAEEVFGAVREALQQNSG